MESCYRPISWPMFRRSDGNTSISPENIAGQSLSVGFRPLPQTTPTSDCRQSLQQSLRRHAHLALVHTSIEHSRDWCRSLLILNCQELAAQQPLRPINWCSRLLKMTVASKSNHVKKTIVIFTPILDCAIQNRNTRYGGRDQLPAHKMLCW